MEYCNDFNHDLKVGQIGEQILGELLSSGTTLEVKRDSWISKTGNLAIEYQSRGNPSGLAKTTAIWWVFIVSGDMNDEIIIIIKTTKLKEIGRYYFKKGCIKWMGDNNTSKAVLIPFKELLKFTKK